MAKFTFLLPEVRRPQWVRNASAAPWLAVGAVCLGAFMGQLDASIVTLAFPTLMTEFSAPLSAVQWVSLSYLVVLAVALVPVGRLSDIHGRKRLYVNGFALFAIASVLCAVSPTIEFLVAARALQALGAAFYQANSVAIVTKAAPRNKLTVALGIQAAAQALGLALGPTIGGYMVQAWGWESVFWINVPIGIIGIFTASLFVPRTREHRQKAAGDALGTILLGITLVAFLAVLSSVSGLDIPWWLLAILLLITVLSGTGLVFRERAAKDPLIPPALLGKKSVSWGLLTAALGYFILFSPLVAYPPRFPEWGVSTGSGGLYLAALPFGFALFAVSANFIAMPARIRMLLGSGVVAVGALLAIPALPYPGWTAATLVVIGAGLGTLIPANNASVMQSTPPLFSSVVGGMLNLGRSVGTSLGVAATTLCLYFWGSAPAVQIMLVVSAALAAVGSWVSTSTPPPEH
ncbi:MAG TPA: MFS transporter [Corynebacteriales bacterium]|nr:MFS transporter [Mycobacteriales bacterium]